MKKLKKTLSILLSLTITAGMFAVLPVTASAAQNPEVNYTKYYPDTKEGSYFTITHSSTNYTIVTKDLMTNSSGGTGKGLTSGTYVVNSNTTIDERVNIVKGAEVNLIIQPNVTLTCNKGIGCGYNKKGEYATLNICGSGKLVATGTKNTAGIGGNDDETSGNILIHGCRVEATGGKHGAGIGGGEGGKDPDDAISIKIFAGDITAKGGVDGAGIGGGDTQQGALTYIYGGKINASSEKHGAGIGGGDEENTRGIYIYNGNITATGGSHGAGIGAGEHGGNIHEIKITGGTIDAKGGYFGAGIGGGFDEDMSGEINISGDVHLTAKAGLGAAGIGAGSGADWFPDGDMDGTIRINAGDNSDIKVYALNTKIFEEYDFRDHTCEDDQIDFSGAGIGAGYGGNMGGEVYITGGNMEIWSGVGGAGIGGGRENTKTGGEGGDVYIGGGNIKVRAITYCESGAHKDLKSYNSAIGCGHYDSKDGSVYIHPNNNTTGKYMKVVYTHLGEYMDDDFEPTVTAKASDRSKKCHTTSWLEISECNHRDHEGVSGLSYTIEGDKHRVKCKYCGYDALEKHDGSIPCGDCGYRDGVTYYSVTLNTQFGDPVQLDTTLQYVAAGKKFTFPECDKVPVGKRFIGWRLVNDTNLRQPGESFEPGSNRTYDAVYADLYSITYNHQIPNDNWISLNKTAADEDDEIIVTAHPYGGYRMKTVTVRENNENGEIIKEIGCEPGKNTCSFKMPAKNIYITAEFEETGYVVGISDTENGTVTAEPPSIAYTAFDNGATPNVTLTATPEEGYHLSKLICKTESGSVIEATQSGNANIYTFAMPQENVQVTAEFEKDSIFIGHSLTLNGDIGVNFFLNLTAEQAENATVSFTWMKDGVEQTASADMSQAPLTVHGYMATCNVAASEMRTDITATVTINGEPIEETDVYSVAEYADVILTDSKFAADYVAYENGRGKDGQQKLTQLRALVEKMLVYGDNAKVYFNKNVEALDDAPTADIPEKGSDITGMPDDVLFDGATLSLRSKTSLSLYFKSNSELSLSMEGKTVDVDYELDSSEDEYVIRIRNIAAKDLGNNFTVTVSTSEGSGTVTYSPMTYCYNAQTSSNAKLVNTVKAIYNYFLAAQTYFG